MGVRISTTTGAITSSIIMITAGAATGGNRMRGGSTGTLFGSDLDSGL